MATELGLFLNIVSIQVQPGAGRQWTTSAEIVINLGIGVLQPGVIVTLQGPPGLTTWTGDGSTNTMIDGSNTVTKGGPFDYQMVYGKVVTSNNPSVSLSGTWIMTIINGSGAGFSAIAAHLIASAVTSGNPAGDTSALQEAPSNPILNFNTFAGPGGSGLISMSALASAAPADAVATGFSNP